MSEYRLSKEARKGTKSCTECRRRKIRCIKTLQDAQSCRGCEDRGTTCIPQIFSAKPHRLPSRNRISQLEAQVGSLNKFVRDIQLKLGGQLPETPDWDVNRPESSPGTNYSDDDSTAAEILPAEEPSHLRSLFQNDWLSVDVHLQQGQPQDRKIKASAHLLQTARRALQKLIPPRDDVLEIARPVSPGLILLHALHPQQFALISQRELVENYDNMHKPDVDPINLASWLLDVAVTAQQIPQEHCSPALKPKRSQSDRSFSRAVSDAVNRTIISHDPLLGTVQGLEMAMHFFRLQMSLGNVQQAWIRLRHFIAIAELMGLPKTSRVVQLNKASGENVQDAQLRRADLWEVICSADRLLAMIINLPPGTKRYQQKNTQAVSIDGAVQPRVYLIKLAEISAKIQYLDEMNTTQEPGAQINVSALEIDGELRALASQTPKSWWDQDITDIKPDYLVQTLHYYTTMRAHLPFTMQRDPGGENIYSRVACMDACQSLAQRYQTLRRVLPSGVFLASILDLQAFTATVVLLLTSHRWSSQDQVYLQTNKAKIEAVVAQVVKLMDEKSNDTTGSNSAQHSATAIRSLRAFLQQNGDASSEDQVALKVPLLGKVHIRRNVGPSQAQKAKNPKSFQASSESALWNPTEQFVSQQQAGVSVDNDAVLESAVQTHAEWPLTPLSWSIENNDNNFFQDALMTDNLDQFDMWQMNFNDLEFNLA